MIRNPRRGKKIHFSVSAKVVCPSLKPISLCLHERLWQLNGCHFHFDRKYRKKNSEATNKNKDTKKVQKNTVVSLPPLLLSKRKPNARNEKMGLLNCRSMHHVVVFPAHWFTSIIWSDVGNLQIDAIGRLNEAHTRIFPQEDFAGRDDPLGLLPNYHRWAWKERLQNKSASCIDV